MIESLRLKDFTVFKDAGLEFAPGLNVIVGENGTGKTHILKLAYSITYVCTKGREPGSAPTKAYLQSAIGKKLTSVFRPDELGRLARRDRRGRQRSEVHCSYGPPTNGLAFSFNTASRSEVNVEEAPSQWIEKLPVYLPTRELLTLFPGFISLYETSYLPFEETWRDTSVLLGAPLARGPREKRIRELLVPLENAMDGKVEQDEGGRFYLNSGGVSTEMHLVAEGFRKLAMIARLIATGSLIDKGFLFWDEPEANLNPRIIKLVAQTIVHLAQSGIQVFVATHSLFLLRELELVLQQPRQKRPECQFIGLHRGDGGVDVFQGATVDDIGEITALEEELRQSDRYLEVEAA
ncbi:MAG TPA: AAA family ATPase [Longimicrobium sp.]|nr:AAA family ATPase [Longimicrobium sp.]